MLILTVEVEDVPQVAEAERASIEDFGEGFYRVILHYGFMEEVDVPRDLARDRRLRRRLRHDEHQLLPRPAEADRLEERPGMALWRERLFAWMMKSSESAMEFFKLPTNRVVELGSQVEI